MTGDCWAMLPSAAGVIDPLLSTGFPLTLLGIGRLVDGLERTWGGAGRRDMLDQYARQTQRELDDTERLVGALYSSMRDFELFKRLTRLYFAAASFSETARRLDRAGLAPGFLLGDHPTFGPELRSIAAMALDGPADRPRADLLDRIDRAIEPFDIAGLGDNTRRDWYPVLADDLLAGASQTRRERRRDRSAARALRLQDGVQLMKTMSRPVVLGVVAAALACGMACNSCRRGAPSAPAVPDAVYRDAVTAFYTGLAAMQTSQDVLARQSIEKVTTLVPDEPAGWANLGLLLLRQQEIEPAMPHLTRAAALAPSNGHIQRLLALAESRRGNLDASIAHWRKAVELDPADTKAAYALAQEMERQGGGDQDAEAQRVLQSLLSRTENLVARLDLARIAAKRGDAVMLKTALEPLQAQAGSWPDEVQQRFRTVEQAAASNPRAAAPAIAFLKNVLLRVPEYRRSLAAVSTPREEVGEPFERFVTLKNPPAQPAAPDSTVAFVIEPVEGVGNAVGFAGVFVPTENAAPEVLTADARQVRVGARTAGAFPGGARATLPTVRGVAAADLNYDYRTDLVLAGDGGLRILRQKEGGAFADVTAAAKLPASVTSGQHWGVWIADIDTEGDLDIVVSTAAGPAAVLRNNGDGSFARAAAVWRHLHGTGVCVAGPGQRPRARRRIPRRQRDPPDVPEPSRWPVP